MWGWGAAPEHGALSTEQSAAAGAAEGGPEEIRAAVEIPGVVRIPDFCAKKSQRCLISFQADSAQREQPSLCVWLRLGQQR